MYVHVCICMSMYMYVSVYVYVCICMYMYVYVCTCMYMYVYVCTCMYMYVHVCICMYMYVHVCTCMYMYVHVCICICIWMYSSDGTDAEPHREEQLIDVAPIDAASDQHLWPFGKTYLVGGWPSPLKKWWSESQVGMIPFWTEWKVIKFHGSKPPISLKHSYWKIAIYSGFTSAIKWFQTTNQIWFLLVKSNL